MNPEYRFDKRLYRLALPRDFTMNLPEFQAALGCYAVSHPDRRLSEVTAIEFAEWYYEIGPVAPGSTLVVGARYRITAIGENDPTPAHKVGDVVIGDDFDSERAPSSVWFDGSEWVASSSGSYGGTYVTGLERIA